MLARTFWRLVVRDRVDFLPRLLQLLADSGAQYCVVGGVAVNAYVEPHITIDFDIVIAAGDIDSFEAALRKSYIVERFAHTTNVTARGSDMRVQIQTDPRYAAFLARAEVRSVLGIDMRVASLEDVLQGKIWAAASETRRPLKRKKDLLDIARLVEAYPHLRSSVPADVLREID